MRDINMGGRYDIFKSLTQMSTNTIYYLLTGTSFVCLMKYSRIESSSYKMSCFKAHFQIFPFPCFVLWVMGFWAPWVNTEVVMGGGRGIWLAVTFCPMLGTVKVTNQLLEFSSMAISPSGSSRSSHVFNSHSLCPFHPGSTSPLSTVCMTLTEQRNFQKLSCAFGGCPKPLREHITSRTFLLYLYFTMVD